MDIFLLIIKGILFLIFTYFFTRIIFDIILRGFTPLISSRPWVIKKIIEEIGEFKLDSKPVIYIYALSCGKSGFLNGIGKKYPQAKLIGVEYSLLPYIVAKIQVFLKRSKIKVLYKKDLYKFDISNADLIYCYLNIKILRNLPKKFKFECKQGTIIISNGIVIPNFKIKKSIELINKKRRFVFFSKHKKIWSSKMKEEKRVNKVYFYKI